MIVYVAMLPLLLTAFGGAVSAATYTPYEGNISTSYLTYFEDLLPKIKLGDHYVLLRSSQYDYSMIVGDITHDNGVFSSATPCTVYTLSSTSGYNSYNSYTVTTVNDFQLVSNDILIYSDLGNFPELETRGNKYEVINTMLICIFMLGVFIRGIFFYRKR